MSKNVKKNLYIFVSIFMGWNIKCSDAETLCPFSWYFSRECYCTFKNHELWSLKDNWCLQFSLAPIMVTHLLGNRTLLKQVQKVMVCDLWLVDFDLFCLFLCFKVHCLWSYYHDWGLRKMQLWRQLLNFRVHMFVKSSVRA